jgi:hypothetical protein
MIRSTPKKIVKRPKGDAERKQKEMDTKPTEDFTFKVEDHKISKTLMAVMELEENWFFENAYMDDKVLQEELEECCSFTDQIYFANKYYKDIKGIEGSLWADSYESLQDFINIYDKAINQ